MPSGRGWEKSLVEVRERLSEDVTCELSGMISRDDRKHICKRQ